MAETWKSIPARDVELGDTVRTANGFVLYVSRIEEPFMGRPEMLAFIEDLPTRWLKAPAALEAPIEVRVASDG